MPGQRIGSVIAATFGLIYVLVNAGSLHSVWAVTLSVLAAVAFAAVLLAVLRAPQHQAPAGARVFGRAYWLVVAAEVVALFAGVRLLDGPFHLPKAGVAWVSVVVGVHFFALAVVFGARFFHVLGGMITACGATGLVLAATGAATAAVALASGVIPGALLLGFAWWGARRTDRAAGQTEPGRASLAPSGAASHPDC
jgi:hypothetical protein